MLNRLGMDLECDRQTDTQTASQTFSYQMPHVVWPKINTTFVIGIQIDGVKLNEKRCISQKPQTIAPCFNKNTHFFLLYLLGK